MAKNFGDKIVGSIGWLLLGVVLIIVSIVISFNVEGRTNYKDVTVQAVSIEDAKDNKAFIYYESDLTIPVSISDDLLLYEDNYVVLERDTEMYSWVEEKKTEDEETYYKYNNEWVSGPADSSEFNKPKDHYNPEKYVEDLRVVAPEGNVGIYKIDLDKVKLPPLSELKLNEDVVDTDKVVELNEKFNKKDVVEDEEDIEDVDGWILGDDDSESGWIIEGMDDEEDNDAVSEEDEAGALLTNKYVFVGSGTMQNPNVGDLRISYRYLDPMDEVTIFGRASGTSIEPHSGEASKNLYRIFDGIKEDAVTQLQSEYETAGWMGRIGVFLLMWIGLMLLLKPLDTVMELIPFVGNLGKGALNLITFVIAFVLTFVISFVLAVLNSTVGFIILGAVVVIGIYLYMNKPKSAAKHEGPGKKQD